LWKKSKNKQLCSVEGNLEDKSMVLDEASDLVVSTVVANRYGRAKWMNGDRGLRICAVRNDRTFAEYHRRKRMLERHRRGMRHVSELSHLEKI
jgi:hypothetical protein